MTSKKELYVVNVYNTNTNTSLNEYGYPYVCKVYKSIRSILNFLKRKKYIPVARLDIFDTDIYGNLSFVREGSQDFYINVKIFSCKAT